MQRFMTILVLGLALAGCAATAPSGPQTSGASAEAEQEQRPLRQAYALKFIEFSKTDDELKQLLIAGTRKGLEEAAPRHSPQDPKRLAGIFERVVLPEFVGRIGEAKDILAGAFADVLTVDELRRLSEFVALPAYKKGLAKQPLTEQDMRDIGPLGLRDLQKRLEETRHQITQLAKTRGEIWGKRIVEELLQRKPDLFREASA